MQKFQLAPIVEHETWNAGIHVPMRKETETLLATATNVIPCQGKEERVVN